jgi:hypothetical protein
MIAQLAILAAMLLPQAPTDNPPGFIVWPKGVPPGGLTEKAPFGNHTLSISHRDKDGLVEVHDKFVDVIVIQTGQATLVVGGKVIEPTTTEPGETRGKSIQGGVKRTLSPGDVIHIPAGLPHQFFIPAGGQITYVLVKIATP